MSSTLNISSSAQHPKASIDLSLPNPIFHERQSLLRCGVHTLNNLVSHTAHTPHASTDAQLLPPSFPAVPRLTAPLSSCVVSAVLCQFQARVYDKFSFDAICDELTPDSWINPHRSLLGVGNYDINVLITALQRHSYSTHWHDRRRALAAIRLPHISALLINTTSLRLLGLYSTQHWYAVRPFAGGSEWWNLNSQLRQPERVENVVEYCEALMRDERTQLLLVTSQELEREQLYESTDQ